MRLIFPLNNKIALTAEGGVNETMLSRGNNGRAVVGVQFGNMIRPKEYLAADHAFPWKFRACATKCLPGACAWATIRRWPMPVRT